ncbi:trk system potassium uptake protein TrkA [Paucilactobacillus hokkaidonensis JCM 18461]|uniref:Trk system potassium uptake protein TrkA n=2 Tax=Paucilactobacillus hokkaidonensis TaxID=1193095 RepID=A0A0A1GS05_9LACO|nr:TrkA family potassium uptake protein [Paucilactobacillus hokkaidonensis]KRO09882.1 potassium uptake protein [Paucilactobacillus hokkaidonensis]BAP84770.1 trk system potassium uptake protein TrkA [Paucilactobacillus hokkaidonensis JCM 18461]
MKQTFAVIGLGRFGLSVCQSLVAAGQEVLAIDNNEELITSYKDLVTQAVIADAQDEDAMRELDLGSFNHVVIALGQNIQASVLSTLIAKELGVKHIIAKAETTMHGKALQKIGADQIVFPERDMGKRVARRLLSHNILNYLELSDTYTLAEIRVENGKLSGKTLDDLNFRKQFGLTLVAIRRGKDVQVSPPATAVIEKGDTLSVIGETMDVEHLDSELSK